MSTEGVAYKVAYIQQAGVVQLVDDVLDGVHHLVGSLQPLLERLDQPAAHVLARYLAHVCEWLQQLALAVLCRLARHAFVLSRSVDCSAHRRFQVWRATSASSRLGLLLPATRCCDVRFSVEDAHDWLKC